MPTRRPSSGSSFTIFGAGAIGGIVGVHLLEAGYDVTFVEANEAHVEAIRENGLKLSGTRECTVHPKILTPSEVRAPVERVLLAVKSRHTEDALRVIAPALAPNGYVLSLQNGLEEYKIARAVGEERTLGAFLTFGGHYLQPGEVVYGGPGTFRIGELDGQRTERIEQLRDALATLQEVEITDNIFGYLWAKMALGAIYFATALVNEDVPDLLEQQRYTALFANIAAEVVAVAEAAGVHVESFDGFDPKVFRFGSPRDPEEIRTAWEAQKAYWDGHVQRRTGVWRDLAVHRRKTEVDELIGAIVRTAERRGQRVPRVEAVVRLVQEVERGQRELGAHNLEDLCLLDERHEIKLPT